MTDDFAFRQGRSIKKSAVRVGRVVYISPGIHAEAWDKAEQDFGEHLHKHVKGYEDNIGFVTDTGRFVNRREATNIVNKRNKQSKSKEVHSTDVMSPEDKARMQKKWAGWGDDD